MMFLDSVDQYADAMVWASEGRDSIGVTPQVAIDAMCKQLRARFDPELL
jgi:hypothetical protein